MHPAGPHPSAQDLRTRYPRLNLEPALAWARRIHKSDERVRALPFQRLIAVLAEVTGSKATHLRQEPALRGADPHLAQLVATLRELVPQQGLGPAPWARRIYKSSARDQLRAMPYKRRIAVLAEVTEGTESNLSQVLELRDTDPEMAQLANTIRTRVPQEDLEAPAAWARRIRDDEEVSAMQYDRRIAVLAAVTGALEGNLRQVQELRDTDPQMAQLADNIRTRVPREDDVRAQQPAPLGLLQAEWRDIEAAIVLMRQRGMVRETAEGAVGLPSGALAAVVDAYGRWLDEHAQAQALVGLTDEQLTSFCQMLEHLHQEL
jgi:hypothetical protein